MNVKLSYGRGDLQLSVPGLQADVVEPRHVDGIRDPYAALVAALESPFGVAPLRRQASASDKIAIVFSDITRPTPNSMMIPAILSTLDHVPDENITLINALGLHRPNTKDELIRMLGRDVVGRLNVLNPDPSDPGQLSHVGKTSSGRPISINRNFVEADVRVVTGFIEPHFFAGFSGGAKSILPGIASQASILANHDAEMISDPNSTWGQTDRNRVFQEAREAAAIVPPNMILNVALNSRREITGVFCGELMSAHDAGCDFVRKTSMKPVIEPYDVVITTNGGWPLDINLYQVVKGISAAARIVKDGGDIIAVAECSEGVGHGRFADILASHAEVDDMLGYLADSPTVRPDQWQAQILGGILKKAKIHVYSKQLSDAQIRGAKCEPCRDLERRVIELVGGDSTKTVCVLPQGPLTIPYVNAAEAVAV